MSDGFYGLMKPFLFRVDPERAHELSIAGLKLGVHPRHAAASDPRLARSLLGLSFPNPIGLAAGFDKNGAVIDALLGLGFGFVEVGTVTPKPQAGNPKPRIFRLEADRAIINRLGFNNEGIAAMRQRLEARKKGAAGIVGVNIGANRDSADRIADYVACVEAFADIASYLTVNVSSPNTPGLRDLQARAALATLIDAVTLARDEASIANGRRTPVLLKIAPDLTAEALSDIAELVADKPVEGAIVANTTLSRTGLTDQQQSETGGMSGRPLFRASTIMLARMRKLIGKQKVLVGVGGIETGDDAFEKIAAGADLVQLYSGFIYRGPRIAPDIAGELSKRLDRDGINDLAGLVGRDMDRWASEAI